MTRLQYWLGWSFAILIFWILAWMLGPGILAQGIRLARLNGWI